MTKAFVFVMPMFSAGDVQKRPDVAAEYAALARDPLLIGYFTDNEIIAWLQRAL